jgi:hypothetical protein
MKEFAFSWSFIQIIYKRIADVRIQLSSQSLNFVTGKLTKCSSFYNQLLSLILKLTILT